MRIPLKSLKLILLAGTFLGPRLVFALPIVSNDAETLTRVLLCTIANYLFYIALIVGIIMALVAAYRYMISGGNEQQVSAAHKTLTWAAVGIAVAILAGSFPFIVASLFEVPLEQQCA